MTELAPNAHPTSQVRKLLFLFASLVMCATASSGQTIQDCEKIKSAEIRKDCFSAAFSSGKKKDTEKEAFSKSDKQKLLELASRAGREATETSFFMNLENCVFLRSEAWLWQGQRASRSFAINLSHVDMGRSGPAGMAIGSGTIQSYEIYAKRGYYFDVKESSRNRPSTEPETFLWVNRRDAFKFDQLFKKAVQSCQ